ncbi:hypothetical protein [Shewanella surugensis]|uniref:DUF3997 domain-containing protein n=1 Tax=Shewanella surugensis TaxID=212020 RepID=A0ABT0LHX7_9GAMM|nr:hypothetical protein [Shewanella surugensis]MCL1127179.1 hypothetical protein [Shewanella surugensis]
MTMRIKFTLLFLVTVLLSACSSHPENLRQCGTVSGYLEPDSHANLYRVVVTHLNGKPVISKPNYWLKPGHYQFTLAELIDNPRLKVALSARKTKKLDIDVVTNEQYHLAAQFNIDRQYTGNNSGYWEPVIWKKETLACELPVSLQE